MDSTIKIAYFTEEDWPAISAIYKEGIDTGVATFETQLPTWKAWDISHSKPCRIKAIRKNTIAGWAALSPTSKREVYKGVAEVSIYITQKYRGLGIGKLLLSKLIEESEKAGFWTLQAGIFRNNKASIDLHKSLGFREIGYREKVAKLDDIWHDNILLERRSKIII
ncbi:GNAT family N-acetyltransferase [Aquimarina megaterium]|uniref:GNAT family N-acetyltransferase n=1 Tax=Aquimarina megaterium TaxID=1443666 RepID=UPI0009424A16|nr:GNAT family N-acetyltransferase [Aquimarina megaterium]